MATFDPSVLQDIQPPDIAGGIAKGFQLKDMVDNHELNQLKLGQEKQTLADNQKIKSILSSSKLNTREGLAEAQEKLTRAGFPDKGMDLRKQASQVESGELDNKLKTLEVHDKAMDFGASLLDPIVAQADAMRSQGKSNAMIDAYIHAQIPLVVQRINENQDLPPDIKQAALKKASQEANMNYDQLKSVEAQSKQGREMIKARIEDLKAQTGQKREVETERHNQSMEGIAARKTTDAEKKAASGGGPEQMAARGGLLAAMATAGVSIPQRNKDALNSTLDALHRQYPDKSDDEIAQGLKSGALSMATEKTEAGVLGRREAAILPVEKSITKPGGFLDQAEQAVNAVDFSKLKAAGKFESWTKDQNSDPALTAYKAAVAELRAEYSIVLSKGGQVTDAARHEAEKVIPDLITKEQFKSIRKTVSRGIEASKGGVEESISGVTGKPAAGSDSKVVNWNDLP